MISTGITGTARQGTWPNSASVMRLNTLQRAAPPRARIASRARAMCGAVGIVADQLQRIVGLDARADVEIAAGIERPAAVAGLAAAQIDPDLALERRGRSRRGNARAARIRPGSSRPPRARTPSGRPPAGGRRGPPWPPRPAAPRHRSAGRRTPAGRPASGGQLGRPPGAGRGLAQTPTLRRFHHSAPRAPDRSPAITHKWRFWARQPMSQPPRRRRRSSLGRHHAGPSSGRRRRAGTASAESSVIAPNSAAASGRVSAHPAPRR